MTFAEYFIEDLAKQETGYDVIRVELSSGREQKYRVIGYQQNVLIIVDRDGVKDTLNPNLIVRYRIEKRNDEEWKK